MLAFGSLFAKVWRVWRIAGSAKLAKNVKVTEFDIAKPVIGLILLELIFLSIWTAIDMPKRTDVLFNNEIYTTCLSDHVFWWIISLAYKALLLIFGVFLAVQIRNFDTAINESKAVALCLYVMLLDLAIMVPVGYALMTIPIVTFIVFAFGISLPYIGITGILFANNLLRIFTGKEPKQVKRGGTTKQTGATAQSANTTTTSEETSGAKAPKQSKKGEKPAADRPGRKSVADSIPLVQRAAEAKPKPKEDSPVSSSSSSEESKPAGKAVESKDSNDKVSGTSEGSPSASGSGSGSGSGSASGSGSGSVSASASSSS
jgi:uncharacterized membrane protein YgcG